VLILRPAHRRRLALAQLAERHAPVARRQRVDAVNLLVTLEAQERGVVAAIDAAALDAHTTHSAPPSARRGAEGGRGLRERTLSLSLFLSLSRERTRDGSLAV
jgi:hypothetical protein